MKTSIPFLKPRVFLMAVIVATTIGATASAQTNRMRVGVYDSRAVAVAWGNSAEFKDTLKPIETEFRKAKESKDEKRAKELDGQMKLQQRRAHEQAFSTGSVAPIMERIKDRLPDIAKQAGVQIIVSKWELNHQSSEVEVVDVTDKLVALFHVTERGLKWSKEVQQKPPLAIEQLSQHTD
jgi:hypothetical protein